jgi:hypothetical protein
MVLCSSSYFQHANTKACVLSVSSRHTPQPSGVGHLYPTVEVVWGASRAHPTKWQNQHLSASIFLLRGPASVYARTIPPRKQLAGSSLVVVRPLAGLAAFLDGCLVTCFRIIDTINVGLPSRHDARLMHGTVVSTTPVLPPLLKMSPVPAFSPLFSSPCDTKHLSISSALSLSFSLSTLSQLSPSLFLSSPPLGPSLPCFFSSFPR